MRIDVYGALRVWLDNGVIGPRDFPGAKPKQLLEMLVAERGHTVSRGRLVEQLWSGDLPTDYFATLNTYMSVLRQAIEPGVPVASSVIMTKPGGYQLDEARTTLDIDEFDRLVARAAGLRPVAALDTLNAALALVRGQVLEDEPYSFWAEQLRSTYARVEVQVRIEAGRLSLITGDHRAAVAHAEQALLLNPVAEAAYQVLMTASYGMHRQEDALRAFDRCRARLADELAVAPMNETLELHLAILRHEDVMALMPQTIQRTVQSVPESTAAAAGLLGRSAELAHLEAAVAHALKGHFSLIVIAGAFGIGKSSLVAALVARVAVPVGSNYCLDFEADLPYAALSLALRRVLQTTDDRPVPVVTELRRRQDLDAPFDHLARVQMMESLATAVEGHSPFLLFLDDVQWADPESIAALGYLRRRCPTAPVAVVLSADRAALQGGSLARLAVDLRIDLTELSPADLDALGPGAFEATQGHPIFVAEWLEARAQGLSEGCTSALRERVLRQCRDLGPLAYRLLTVAALLDEPFSPALLGELIGPSGDVIDALDLQVAGRLLSPVGESFRFHQPLVRQILAETLSPARRAYLLARAENITRGTLRRRETDAHPRRRSNEMAGEGARIVHAGMRDVVGAVGQAIARSTHPQMLPAWAPARELRPSDVSRN